MAEKIRLEIETLEVQQEDIERRIARLKQALIGLAPLSEESAASMLGDMGVDKAAWLADIGAMGITDAVRQILQAEKHPLAPMDIKQRLISMGVDLSRQKNVMASIHSLLKRLRQRGEVETKDNGLTYRWRGRRRFPRYGRASLPRAAATGALIGEERKK